MNFIILVTIVYSIISNRSSHIIKSSSTSPSVHFPTSLQIVLVCTPIIKLLPQTHKHTPICKLLNRDQFSILVVLNICYLLALFFIYQIWKNHSLYVFISNFIHDTVNINSHCKLHEFVFSYKQVVVSCTIIPSPIHLLLKLKLFLYFSCCE